MTALLNLESSTVLFARRFLSVAACVLLVVLAIGCKPSESELSQQDEETAVEKPAPVSVLLLSLIHI